MKLSLLFYREMLISRVKVGSTREARISNSGLQVLGLEPRAIFQFGSKVESNKVAHSKFLFLKDC